MAHCAVLGLRGAPLKLADPTTPRAKQAKAQEEQRLAEAEAQLQQIEQELASFSQRRGALNEQLQEKQSQLDELRREQEASKSRYVAHGAACLCCSAAGPSSAS